MSDETPIIPLPADLVRILHRLNIENPQDARLMMDALMARSGTKATISWLAALVARDGVRYDDDNPEHRQHHAWPPA